MYSKLHSISLYIVSISFSHLSHSLLLSSLTLFYTYFIQADYTHTVFMLTQLDLLEQSCALFMLIMAKENG